MQPILRSVTARFEASGDSRKVRGLASVWYDGSEGTQYQLGERHFERIDPKAFDRSLKAASPIFLLFNHDPQLLLLGLGIDRGVNLTLATTPEGLEFTADLNSTSWANDALACVRENQVGGCSFKYYPTKIDRIKEGQNDISIIRDGYQEEVSVCYQPAYESTEVIVRSLNNLAEYEKRLARIIDTEDPSVSLPKCGQ